MQAPSPLRTIVSRAWKPFQLAVLSMTLLKKLRASFPWPGRYDFSEGERSPKEIARTIEAKGYVVLRGALDPAGLQTLHDAVWRFLEPMLAYRAQEELPDKNKYSVTNHAFALEALIEEDPEALDRIKRLLAPTVTPAMQAYFGTDHVNLRAPSFRHQIAARDSAHVPWHQDGFNLPSTLRILNCWVPLGRDGAGRVAPGVEFLSRRPSEVLKRTATPKTQNYAFLEPDEGAIAQLSKRCALINPDLRQGDVLIFDPLILHRTSSRAQMTARRISAELRIVGSDQETMAYLNSVASPYYALPTCRDGAENS